MIADKSRRAILVYAMLAARTIALSTPTALAANSGHVPGSIWFAQARKSANWIACLRREPLDRLNMWMILSHPCCWDDKPVKLGAHKKLTNLPSKLILS
jgi:hypothetical protein